MAEIYFTVYNKDAPNGKVVTIVEVEGAIGDTAAVDVFEKKITELVNDNEINLVLKMSKLRYLNSSSMGILVKFIDVLNEKGGGIVLAEAAPDIKNPINLLGLDSVIKMTDTEEEAINHFGGTSQPSQAHSQPIDETKEIKIKELKGKDKALKETEAKKKADQVKPKAHMKVDIERKAVNVNVLMVVPSEDFFEKIMRKKFNKKKAKLSVFHSADQADSALKSKPYDLIVLDEAVKGGKEFLNNLKRNKDTSMIPVLKIYGEGASVSTSDGLTVSEDNRLQEPFDLDQLSELSMVEFDKIERRKQQTDHHISFIFNSRQQDIEQVNDLILDLMRQTGLEEKAAISLGAAFREGTDNANRHGNKSQEDRKVKVDYNLNKDKVLIQIEDEGEGFDWSHYMGVATDKSAAQRSRERNSKGKRGGLGIMLMLKCTDEVKYNERGNELTLIKSRA